MLRFIFSGLVFLLPGSVLAQQNLNRESPALEEYREEPPDSLRESPPVPRWHQLRAEMDIISPILAKRTEYPQMPEKTHWSFSMDYFWRHELYAVLEAGWGSAQVRFDNLQYDSRSQFLRLGFQKGLFARSGDQDWDLGFLGLRYGLAQASLSEAWFRTDHYFWGPRFGTQEPRTVWLHWVELTAGMRMRLWKGVSCGWNMRMKLLANGNQVSELPPAFVAGYGGADRNSAFEMNFYLGYALSWSRNARTKEEN